MRREKKSVFVLSQKKVQIDKRTERRLGISWSLAELLFDSLFDCSLFLSHRFRFSVFATPFERASVKGIRTNSAKTCRTALESHVFLGIPLSCISHESIKEWPTPDHMCPLWAGKNNIVYTSTLTLRLRSIMDISGVSGHRVKEIKRGWESHGVMLPWEEEEHGSILFFFTLLESTLAQADSSCVDDFCLFLIKVHQGSGTNPTWTKTTTDRRGQCQRTGQCRRSQKNKQQQS